MAWGSNVTNIDFRVDQPEFDAQGWNTLVKEKRGRDYTMKVAEARKGVREKFGADREAKMTAKMSEEKKAIQMKIDAVNKQIHEVSNRLMEISKLESNQQNADTKANMSTEVPVGQNTQAEVSMFGYNPNRGIR